MHFIKPRRRKVKEAEVLHYFWVQLIKCRDCGTKIEAHPHYQLAFEAKGERQWIFCPNCHKIYQSKRGCSKFFCHNCKCEISIHEAPVKRGRVICPECMGVERLIDVAYRTKCLPEWCIFALETLEPPIKKRLPMSQRQYRPASDFDRSIYARASSSFSQRQEFMPQWTPTLLIPKEHEQMIE